MTLGEATSRFLIYVRQCPSTVHPQIKPEIHDQALRLVIDCYSNNASLDEITPANMRDFLSRWYVERASGLESIESMSVGPVEQTAGSHGVTARPTDLVLEPLDLLDSIEEFIDWADEQTGADQAAVLLPVLRELRLSLPRALAITGALTNSVRQRGGGFSFPEFLTSFEEGGSSQYDIDVPGNVGAMDGYFRIIRLDGVLAEAEELISEERVWPIVFPAEVAALLDDGYIINLELVRKAEGWQIAGCGFAYPPGTEIS